MKKLIFSLAVALNAVVGASCQGGENKQAANDAQVTANPKTTLVAYFSATGITKAAAEKVAVATGGTLFEIVPEVPYTAEDLDWTNKQSRSTLEMKDSTSRPPVKQKVEGMEKYEVVYLGFPIWWYIAPTIVNTFLEQYDMTGKTIVPFFTSGSSEAGETVAKLAPSAPKATILPAKNLTGKDAAAVEEWVKSLKF